MGADKLPEPPRRRFGESVLTAGETNPPPVGAAALQSLTSQSPAGFVGGIPRDGLAALAEPLEAAQQSTDDEIRFCDAAPESSVHIEIGDIESLLSEHPADLTIDRVALLASSALFSDISPAALEKLARAATMVECAPRQPIVTRGEAADSLYVIVEGSVWVQLPFLKSGGVELTAGQVFGETCLLAGAQRQASVLARETVTLLRIDTTDLKAIADAHPEVHQTLFKLLVQRMVANTMRTSPLFASVPAAEKAQLVRRFEIRKARADTMLQARGKRPDAAYVALVGEFESDETGSWQPMALGTSFGGVELKPAAFCVRTKSESLVLRLPASRVGST